VTGVLQQCEAVVVGEDLKRPDVGGHVAAEVDGHDRHRLVGDGVRDRCGRQGQRVAFDVGEDRRPAGGDDGVRRRGERKGGDDHLAVGEAVGEEVRVQRRRAGVERDGMPGARGVGHLAFELTDFGAVRPPRPALDDVGDRGPSYYHVCG